MKSGTEGANGREGLIREKRCLQVFDAALAEPRSRGRDRFGIAIDGEKVRPASSRAAACPPSPSVPSTARSDPAAAEDRSEENGLWYLADRESGPVERIRSVRVGIRLRDGGPLYSRRIIHPHKSTSPRPEAGRGEVEHETERG